MKSINPSPHNIIQRRQNLLEFIISVTHSEARVMMMMMMMTTTTTTVIMMMIGHTKQIACYVKPRIITW
jgi:hypothetical protein